MALKSRNKGKRGEREVVTMALSHGIPATRCWQTAQSPDPIERCCDVQIAGLKVQVKLTASGFQSLYAALQGVDLACVRSDHKEWLAVLPLESLLALLAHDHTQTKAA
jgi:hypothetical protein